MGAGGKALGVAISAATVTPTQLAVTDSTTGTPSTTLADVTPTPTQALINNNFASVAARIAEIKVDIAAIIAALQANGMMD